MIPPPKYGAITCKLTEQQRKKSIYSFTYTAHVNNTN